jgi:hypothetical protein
VLFRFLYSKGFLTPFLIPVQNKKNKYHKGICSFSGGELGIRFARLRSLGRSRSQQSTGLLLCAARPSSPALKKEKSQII